MKLKGLLVKLFFVKPQGPKLNPLLTKNCVIFDSICFGVSVYDFFSI